MFQGMTLGEQRTLLGLAVIIGLGLGVQAYNNRGQYQPVHVQHAQQNALASQGPAAAAPASADPGATPRTATTTPVPTPTPAGPLDLNAATFEELDALPGIGPVRAQQILDLRERQGRLRSVEDLLQIPGIGEKTVNGLRQEVVVGP